MIGADAFAGTWILRRRIEDHLAKAEGAFDGQVVLTPISEGGLRYEETGVLRLGASAPMQASRVYHWQFTPDRVVVTFEDGRPFHSFVPEGAGPGTDHPCGADYYRVAYDFTNWPKWSTEWTVTGPRKNYAMQTVYHPS